ncbi:MAG: glycosyltransferase [Lachnospiraceae bacterium]|nr:glycosyltransferase [Lachnospiraceae bacterium]
MITELVSVIIPVYNADSYLPECLDSVIGQTYSDLEIILIDDGATDNTGKICDQYADKDPRIRVLHQENLGAAAARKQGIQTAKGQYLCFVDADDKVDSTMFEYMATNIGDCDLITSGCHCEKENGERYQRYDIFTPGIYESDEELRYFLRNFISFDDRTEDGVLPFLWTKMFKKEIAQEVLKTVDLNIRYAEDRDFLFQYILKCKSICITHACFYHYRINSGSIVQGINKNIMNDLNNLYLSLERAFSKHHEKKALMHQLQLYIISRIYQIPRYMRFDEEVQIVRYAFPFNNLSGENRLILYGAGKIGCSYYRQIKQKKEFDLALWVDKNWEKYQDRFVSVVSPENIKGVDFDYIIIGVLYPQTAEEIKEELKAQGIPEDKIWWEEPISLREY